MRKRWLGVPVAVLLAVATTVAAAASVIVLEMSAKVRYPTHQAVSLNFEAVPAGKTVTKEVTAFFGLPDTYVVTWHLLGDLDKFQSVRVNIDYNSDGVVDATLTKTSPTVSLTVPEGVYTARYSITVSAKLELKTGTSIVEEDATISVAVEVSLP